MQPTAKVDVRVGGSLFVNFVILSGDSTETRHRVGGHKSSVLSACKTPEMRPRIIRANSDSRDTTAVEKHKEDTH